MAIKRIKKTVAPKANHVVVGFSFPDQNRPNEHVTASTRYGIWLSLSSQIYAHLLQKTIDNPEPTASLAFDLADTYLQELDIRVAEEIAKNPPTPSNNGN